MSLRLFIYNLTAIICTVTLLTLVSTVNVGAQNEAINNVCSQAPDSPVCKDLESQEDPVTGDDGIFIRVFNVLSIIAGIAAVIIIIIGGIQMMTSDGDPQKFANARNLLIYAAVGIVIVLFAQPIVRLVVVSLIE